MDNDGAASTPLDPSWTGRMRYANGDDWLSSILGQDAPDRASALLVPNIFTFNYRHPDEPAYDNWPSPAPILSAHDSRSAFETDPLAVGGPTRFGPGRARTVYSKADNSALPPQTSGPEPMWTFHIEGWDVPLNELDDMPLPEGTFWSQMVPPARYRRWGCVSQFLAQERIEDEPGVEPSDDEPGEEPTEEEPVEEPKAQEAEVVVTSDIKTLGAYGDHLIDMQPVTRDMVSPPIETPTPEVEDPARSAIWGVTYEPTSDNIFAADRDGRQILRFSISRRELILEDKFPESLPGCEEPFRPTGIVCDSTHTRLIVTDKDNHRVVFLAYSGTFLGTFGRHGQADGEFNSPWGVAVSPDGTLIAVADSKNHRLQLFTARGEFIRKFEVGPHEREHAFENPRGIAFDNSGQTIYVSDFDMQKVFTVDVEFTQLGFLSRRFRFRRPQGLTVHSGGNILVCDSRANAITVIKPNGRHVKSLKDVRLPVDLCICRRGLLCVVDHGGSRIRLL